MKVKQEIIKEIIEEITNWCVIREYNLTERDIAQLAIDLYFIMTGKTLCEEYEERKIKQLEFDVQTARNNFDRIKSKRIEKLEQLRENILKSECGGLWVTIKDIDEMIERIARNLE